MRIAILLLLGVVSACLNNEPPSIEASTGVRVRCFVPEPDCTTSYRLAIEAVDPRFSPNVRRADVRATEVRLCPYGDPQYDVDLTDDKGQVIEVTVARMDDGELIACTY